MNEGVPLAEDVDRGVGGVVVFEPVSNEVTILVGDGEFLSLLGDLNWKIGGHIKEEGGHKLELGFDGALALDQNTSKGKVGSEVVTDLGVLGVQVHKSLG